MDKQVQRVTAPDGRRLTAAEWGDPAGWPVFFLHGTPGSRFSRHPDEDLVRSAQVRMITYDRPGYGGSARQPGRTVAACAADVAAIADDLGIGRFAVAGGSGGGPHALAVAALLSHRVSRAACVGGVAPYPALGDAFFAGMDPQNVTEFGWALRGEAPLAAGLQEKAVHRKQQAAAGPAQVLAKFDLPEADQKVLARDDFAAMFRQTLAEELRQGVVGWVDDDLALVSAWGFDPAAIAVPTQVWYGTRDVLVPPGHGEWIARTVPGATVRLNELGHMGDPDADLRDLLGWLTSPARAAG
jgi:pimeloyl-ACP methyl ester carboxylesterase